MPLTSTAQTSPAALSLGTPSAVAAAPLPQPCVLIVDDDPHFRALAKGLLAPLGISVAEAETGREALNYLKLHSQGVHAVVLDIFMPGRDGLEVIKEMRDSYSHLKVLSVSGVPSGSLYLQISSILGADAVLSKSEIERLPTVVLDLLER